MPAHSRCRRKGAVTVTVIITGIILRFLRAGPGAVTGLKAQRPHFLSGASATSAPIPPFQGLSSPAVSGFWMQQ